MTVEKKGIEGKLFHLKVYIKVLYCIGKYFLMWDIQRQEKQ